MPLVDYMLLAMLESPSTGDALSAESANERSGMQYLDHGIVSRCHEALLENQARNRKVNTSVLGVVLSITVAFC